MFHHFHDEKHLPAQGSLCSKDFSDMIGYLGDRYNLIGANEYLEKFTSSKLKSNDICLSFDDALLCQYDIALPVLDAIGIDAFFFVYSSVLCGMPNNLEIFRYFRTSRFTSIDDFYLKFFSLVYQELDDQVGIYLSEFKLSNYLNAFPFYTENDRWFRYLRDQILGPDHYENLMLKLMEESEFYPQEIIGDLWMSESNVKEIAARGHVVGLHSFSHPTQMSKLTHDEQLHEYGKNYLHLSSLVGDVVAMAHPCGDYNQNTLEVLNRLGIRMGFRSSLSTTKISGKFEVPREDHANIMKAMKI